MTMLIAHEWIERHGGSERVVDVMLDEYPDAHLFCLWDNSNGRYPSSTVIESVLAESPLRGRKAAAALAMPAVWKNLDVLPYSDILVSSHTFAHLAGSRRLQETNVQTRVYVHSPDKASFK